MLAEEVHSRQAAALYLKAAALTDDAGVRRHLRRRAAQLITTPPDHRRPNLES
jgi:hypothetical protein